MNMETGQIYRGEEEVRAAVERGERVEPLSQAEVMKAELAGLEALQRGRSFVRDPKTGLKLRG